MSAEVASTSRPAWINWAMAVTIPLVVAAATGLATMISGISSDISEMREKDLADQRRELAVLKATWEENSKSTNAIHELRNASIDERYKNVMIEIDRIKHNVGIIADKIEDMENGRRRRR